MYLPALGMYRFADLRDELLLECEQAATDVVSNQPMFALLGQAVAHGVSFHHRRLQVTGYFAAGVDSCWPLRVCPNTGMMAGTVAAVLLLMGGLATVLAPTCWADQCTARIATYLANRTVVDTCIWASVADQRIQQATSSLCLTQQGQAAPIDFAAAMCGTPSFVGATSSQAQADETCVVVAVMAGIPLTVILGLNLAACILAMLSRSFRGCDRSLSCMRALLHLQPWVLLHRADVQILPAMVVVQGRILGLWTMVVVAASGISAASAVDSTGTAFAACCAVCALLAYATPVLYSESMLCLKRLPMREPLWPRRRRPLPPPLPPATVCGMSERALIGLGIGFVAVILPAGFALWAMELAECTGVPWMGDAQAHADPTLVSLRACGSQVQAFGLQVLAASIPLLLVPLVAAVIHWIALGIRDWWSAPIHVSLIAVILWIASACADAIMAFAPLHHGWATGPLWIVPAAIVATVVGVWTVGIVGQLMSIEDLARIRALASQTWSQIGKRGSVTFIALEHAKQHLVRRQACCTCFGPFFF